MKLILLVIILAAIAAGLWFALSGKEEEAPQLTGPAAPVTEPVAETPAQPDVAPTGEVAPTTAAAPSNTATPGSEPAAVAPTPPAPAAPASPAPTAPVAEAPKAPAPKIEPKVEPPAPKAPTPPPERMAVRTPPPAAKKPVKAPVEKARTPAPAPREEEEERPAPAPSAGPGKLRVTSTPSGAEVLVNFSKKGNTPVEITLSNNTNKIIVRMPGYKRFETTLPKNHPERALDVELDKEGGTEVARTPEPEAPKPRAEPARPAPSRVEEDEEDDNDPEELPMARSTPERRPEPPAAKPEPPARAKAEAAPAPGDGPIGVIFLSSSPARADIIIDGKNTGKKTPAKVELPSGPHRIEMVKSGQRDVVDHQVNEGKNKALHLILK